MNNMALAYHRGTRERGATVVEGLIAALIALAVMVGLVSTYNLFVRLVQMNTETVQALYLLEEGVAALHMIRDTAWYGVSSVPVATMYYLSFDGASWATTTTPENIDGFTRSFVLEDVYRDGNDDITTSGGTLDPGTKLATFTVSWDSRGTARTRTLSRYITNLFEEN